MLRTRCFKVLFLSLTVFQLIVIGWAFIDDSRGISTLASFLPPFLNLFIYDLLTYLYEAPLLIITLYVFREEPSKIINLLVLLPFMAVYSLILTFLVCTARKLLFGAKLS